MPRITLQIKNVATLLLSATASISAAISVRKFFEHGLWFIPATCLTLALACQIALLFVESKEEEELSLLRKQRLDRTRHAIAERDKITQRIQHEIEFGTAASAAKWKKYREESE